MLEAIQTRDAVAETSAKPVAVDAQCLQPRAKVPHYGRYSAESVVACVVNNNEKILIFETKRKTQLNEKTYLA